MIIYTIYKSVNRINGKVYIGFTGNFTRRISEHKISCGKNTNIKFYNAIRKYGWNSFEWEIIYQSKNFEHTLKIMEPHFIREYDSFHNGYNTTLGGEGLLGYRHTNQTKNKLRKPLTEEHKLKLCVARNKRIDLPMLGKQHSVETKEKISKKRKGVSNYKLYKKIMTPKGLFESVTLAAKFYGHNVFYMSRKIKNNPRDFYFVS